MKFGLSDQQYEILEKLLIQPMHSHEVELSVFGSRARGTHHPFSDIDILYKEDSNNPLPADILSQIKENLENSNLSIKVDLVSESNLANSYRESVQMDLKKIEPKPFLGMPTQWDLKNWNKDLWNPESDELFPPKRFGVGYGLNFHALLRKMGLLKKK